MFTTPEYWILDALSTGGVRLKLLFEDLEALRVNYFTEPHPYPLKEMKRCSIELAAQGLVEIRSALQVPFMALTAMGGRAWEDWAEPDWTQYYSESYECIYASVTPPYEYSVEQVYIIAGSTQRLDDAISYLFNRRQGRIIGMTDVGEISPWEVFDWKTLSCGTTKRLIFDRGDSTSLSSVQGAETPVRAGHFRRWCKRGFNPTQCFNLEAW